MPLLTRKSGDRRGTEVDGSLSDTWCSLCYEHGAFIGPDCTLDQMLDIVDSALKKQGSNRVMRWLAAKQIPSLQRWNHQ